MQSLPRKNPTGFRECSPLAAAGRRLLRRAQAFTSALRLDLNYLQALNNLSVVQESLRHYPEAEQVYRQAVAREPRHLLARSNLGGEAVRKVIDAPAGS